MANNHHKQLSAEETTQILKILKARFDQNMNRHEEIKWAAIQSKLETNTEKLWSLNEMEKTGGEPDVVQYDKKSDTYIFMDCAAESPKGRRSVCFDREALDSRKEHKPHDDAMSMAAAMGVRILTEQEYRLLQSTGEVDLKTSSWIATPAAIRELGGALFADRRYNTVFVYHNGASSYYAARGFRSALEI